MNQTYSKWYELDVNIVSIIIATCINQRCSEYEWLGVNS